MPLQMGNMQYPLPARSGRPGSGFHRIRLEAGESRVIDKSPVQPRVVHNNGPGVVLIEGRSVQPGGSWSPTFPGQCVFAVTTIDDGTEVGID